MQNKLFLKAADICELLEVKQTSAYEIIGNLSKELEEQGVIYVDFETAVKEYPDLIKPYFGKLITPNYHKFAALHYAVWSGGSFVY